MCPDHFSEKTLVRFTYATTTGKLPLKSKIMAFWMVASAWGRSTTVQRIQTWLPLINPVRVIVGEFARVRIFRAKSTLERMKNLHEEISCLVVVVHRKANVLTNIVMHRQSYCLLLIIFFLTFSRPSSSLKWKAHYCTFILQCDREEHLKYLRNAYCVMTNHSKDRTCELATKL